MDSYRPNNNPMLFSCSLCGEYQSKHLPPGTKMTGCGKCGNLITVADLTHRKPNQTPYSNNTASSNRRNPPLNRNNQLDDFNYFNSNNEDELYSQSNNRLNYRSPQSHQKNTNNNQQQQQQGMFSLHFPNENYNKYSSNARRFNQDRDAIEDEGLFDLEFENELNQLMRIGQMGLSRQALNDMQKLTLTSSSTKSKIPKMKMNKKLYAKNAKGKLEAPTCCICLTLMKLDDEISQIKCKHLFHYHCLQKWIETKEECPFCRGKLI